MTDEGDENDDCPWVKLGAENFDSCGDGLLGKVYRMRLQCPDFSSVVSCSRYGVSLLLTRDVGGHLLLSCNLLDGVAHVAMPLELKGNTTGIEDLSKQKSISIELNQFKDRCKRQKTCDGEVEVLTASISLGDPETLTVLITTMSGAKQGGFKLPLEARVSDLVDQIIKLRPKWAGHVEVHSENDEIVRAQHLLRECTTLALQSAKVLSCEGTNKEASWIVDCLLDETLSEGGGYCLKLYGTKPGVKIVYEDASSANATGAANSVSMLHEISQPGDIVMTTPNCDELGHYLFRPTGRKVIFEETVNAAMLEEMSAWEDIFRDTTKMSMQPYPKPPVTLEVGNKIVVEWGFHSINEPPAVLSAGLVGTVIEIDEDGDAEVSFKGSFEESQFVAASKFEHVAKVTSI